MHNLNGLCFDLDFMVLLFLMTWDSNAFWGHLTISFNCNNANNNTFVSFLKHN